MTILLLALTLAVAQNPPLEAAQAAPDAETLATGRRVLAELSAASAGTRLLVADYVQTQTSLLFEEPLVSRGKLFLRADPGTLVMRVEKPAPIWMRSDATSHQVWYRDKARAERFLFHANEMGGALLGSLGAEAAALEKTFLILEASSSETEGFVALVPREARLRTALARLELRTVREAAGVRLASVAYANPEQERTVLELQAPARNPELPDVEEIFSTALPAEVRLLSHDLREKAPAAQR